MFIVIILAIIFSPLSVSAATEHVPQSVITCVDRLSAQSDNPASGALSFQAYAWWYINCFKNFDATRLLPSYTDDSIKDLPGASCIVEVERAYLHATSSPAQALQMYTVGIANCHQKFSSALTVTALGTEQLPPSAAALVQVPAPVMQCVTKLASEYTARGDNSMSALTTYTAQYRACFVNNGAEKILPSNTGDGVKDFSGASCLVSAQYEYDNAEKGKAATATFTKSVNKCYEQFPTVIEPEPASGTAQLIFTDAYDDKTVLSDEDKIKLVNCVRQYLTDSTSSPSAEQDRLIAACFSAVAMPNIAQSYQNAATIIDCARDATGITGLANITTITDKQRAYYEQCVTSKVIVPLTTGAAVAAVPLAAGFGNIFLYLQFLFTQPAMLLARRKGNRGKVVDSLTTLPLDLSTVRLLRLPERTIVKTIVTGSTGDYIFVPPPGDYALDALRRDYVFPSTYHDGYRGESLNVDSADDVINKVVPLDRKEIIISVSKFLFAKWRRRIGVVLAFGAPLVSLVGAVLTPKWWAIGLTIFQFALLALFYRLGRGHQTRVFGVVKDEQGKTLSGTVVSLFDKKFNKLLYYSVTDLFGRYTLPEVQGVFAISFAKDGYTVFQRDFNLSDTLSSADIMLTKKTTATV